MPPTPDAFASTDEHRSAVPLRHAQHARFDEPFNLDLGGSLPGVQVVYETHGSLNADRSNAVLICHALTGDSHVARHHDDPDDDPGWWDDMVGPGPQFPIDTDRFFVICPNILGGCRGTTGPESIDPRTNAPFGPTFPDITVHDIVQLQRMLLARLGITRLRAVVGGSLGGQQALTWATRYPAQVQTCVAIATSARLTSQALAFDVIARNAIQTDPHFHQGRYYGQPEQPRTGLAIARMLGHITYLSSEAMDLKFDLAPGARLQPRDLQTAFEKKFSVGSYLAYQGHRFVERFDANSYLRISMAMDLFDLGKTPAQLQQALSPAACDFLLVSFSSDWLFTPKQSRDIVQALTALRKGVTYCEITTAAGHDAFLLPREVSLYGSLVAAKLGVTDDSPPHRKLGDDRIFDLIAPDESVLDCGCGEGHLLARLRARSQSDSSIQNPKSQIQNRQGTGATRPGSLPSPEPQSPRREPRLCGIEVEQAKIIATAGRGLDVIDYDLNQGLPGFADHSFDVVVLSATLQSIVEVERLVEDMLRVGRRCIVSFPNFAHHVLRESFHRTGRLPKTPAPGLYGYDWYNTPNRRFPSILDFEEFCTVKGVTVLDRIFLDTATDARVTHDPNLNADLAVFVLTRT
jgi:homoserine O-acetyltransferase